MRAIDPLGQRRGWGRRRGFRAVAPIDPEPGETARRRVVSGSTVLKCAYRPPDANFFCFKYGVWYNLMDCCYRHARRTYEGCVECGQGRSNVQENRSEFLSRFRERVRRAAR